MGREGPKPAAVSKTSQVVKVLQERIASQAIGPGARLQETELALMFSASRTVIREALSSLEQRGLVTRIPNRGAIVKRLEVDEVDEIFEIREWLEAMLTYNATVNAPDGFWKKYIDRFESLQDQILNGQIEAYNDLLEDLRSDMLRLSDNKIAGQFVALILDRARVIKKRLTLLPGRAEEGRIRHLEMLKFMDAKMPDDAQRVKREIIRSARKAFHQYHTLII